jgi:hypothetical protein
MKTPDDHSELLCQGRRRGCTCTCRACPTRPHGKVETRRGARRRRFLAAVIMAGGLYFAYLAGRTGNWVFLWQLAIPWMLLGCLIFWRAEAVEGVGRLAERLRNRFAQGR